MHQQGDNQSIEQEKEKGEQVDRRTVSSEDVLHHSPLENLEPWNNKGKKAAYHRINNIQQRSHHQSNIEVTDTQQI